MCKYKLEIYSLDPYVNRYVCHQPGEEFEESRQAIEERMNELARGGWKVISVVLSKNDRLLVTYELKR